MVADDVFELVALPRPNPVHKAMCLSIGADLGWAPEHVFAAEKDEEFVAQIGLTIDLGYYLARLVAVNPVRVWDMTDLFFADLIGACPKDTKWSFRETKTFSGRSDMVVFEDKVVATEFYFRAMARYQEANLL